MFTHTCTACERRQLIFPSQVTSVDGVDTGAGRGIAYTFTCWCGQQQTALQVTHRHQTVRAA